MAKTYFTGKPCKRGHVAERWLASGDCVECARNWAAANKDKARARMQKFRAKNRERLILAQRECGKEHRTKYNLTQRALKHRWRARQVGAEGEFTAADVVALMDAQNRKCLCGTALDAYHIDHKIPMCRSGSNWPDNIQLLCPPCNRSKANKTMAEWRP